MVEELPIPPRAGVLASLRQDKHEISASAKALKDLLEREYPSVSYLTILDWAKQTFVTPQNESLAAAGGINGWLSVKFDPHTRISPSELQRYLKWSNEQILSGVGIVLSQTRKLTYAGQ